MSTRPPRHPTDLHLRPHEVAAKPSRAITPHARVEVCTPAPQDEARPVRRAPPSPTTQRGARCDASSPANISPARRYRRIRSGPRGVPRFTPEPTTPHCHLAETQNGDALKIHIVHTRKSGTLVLGAARDEGPGTVIASVRGRWRFSHAIGAWYLPKSCGHRVRHNVIDRLAAALRQAGHEVEVTITTSSNTAAAIDVDRAVRAVGRSAFPTEVAQDRISSAAARLAAIDARHTVVQFVSRAELEPAQCQDHERVRVHSVDAAAVSARPGPGSGVGHRAGCAGVPAAATRWRRRDRRCSGLGPRRGGDRLLVRLPGVAGHRRAAATAQYDASATVAVRRNSPRRAGAAHGAGAVPRRT